MPRASGGRYDTNDTTRSLFHRLVPLGSGAGLAGGGARNQDPYQRSFFMAADMSGMGEYHVGEHDDRPWGDWRVIDVGERFVVKRIRVAPGGILSLQRHKHRAEDWVIVAGTAEVTRNDEVFCLTAGQCTHHDLGDIHRIANHGTTDVVFIEVQQGEILSEADIERLEDTYGRT